MRLFASLAFSTLCLFGAVAAAPPEPPRPDSLPADGVFRYMSHEDESFIYMQVPPAATTDGYASTWAVIAAVDPEPYKGDMYGYLAIYVQFDCEGMRQRILGSLTYSETDQIIPDQSRTQPWGPIQPDTHGAQLLALVCHPEDHPGADLQGAAAFQADLRARRKVK